MYAKDLKLKLVFVSLALKNKVIAEVWVLERDPLCCYLGNTVEQRQERCRVRFSECRGSSVAQGS